MLKILQARHPFPVFFCLLLITAISQVVFGQEDTLDHPAKNEQIPSLLPLEDLLLELENQFDLSFLYEPSVIPSKPIDLSLLQTAPPQDDFFKELALYSNLAFRKIAHGVYVIKPHLKEAWMSGSVYNQHGEKLIGATLYFENTTQGIATDEDGFYKILLPAGHHFVQISYIGYHPTRVELQVPYGGKLEKDFLLKDPIVLKEIVVLASRFRPHDPLETVVPVDIISEAELTQLPQWELTQLLQYLSPSFHSTYQTISDGTDHVDPAMLRGLGPDQVLVMINGKRRHHSALVNVNGTVGRGSVGTDLNAIPVSAVKRIEILRDGAAAKYGSDAIAGVINIILKDNHDANQLQAQTGISIQGDGALFKIAGNYGLKMGQRGFTHLSISWNHRGSVDRSGDYSGPVFGDERDKDSEATEAFFAQTGYHDHHVMSVGSAAIDNFGFFYNAQFELNNSTNFYSHGGFNYRYGQSAGFYRFPYQEHRQSGLYPFGFSPQIRTDIFDISNTMGIKVLKAGWTLDFSNNFGQNSFDFTIKNSNNASMGLASPTTARAGGFSYRQNNVKLDISKTIDGSLPLHLAFGGAFRIDNFQQIQGDEWSWKHYGDTTSTGQPKEAGIQVFPGFRPANKIEKIRSNTALYTDIELEATQRFILSLAARFERYSDFGSNLSWKLAGRYRLHQRLSLRTAFNTGFRAPSMPQIYFSSTSLQFIPVENQLRGLQVAHTNSESSLSHLLGIAPLKAELSTNWSGGGTAQLFEGLSLSFDAYHIHIRDRIVLTGRIDASGIPEFAQVMESFDISRVQFFTNALTTQTIGFDLTGDYQLQLGKSKARISAAYNYNQTKVLAIRLPKGFSDLENQFFNREEISRLEKVQPKSKLILGLTYGRKNWQTHIRSIRFGQVSYIHPDDDDPQNWAFNELNGRVESRDQVFSEKWITDVSFQWHGLEKLVLAISANNIFDVYPDEHTHSANISQGVFRYSRTVQQFGVLGAFWSVKLLLKV